jgi:hypothetical protein
MPVCMLVFSFYDRDLVMLTVDNLSLLEVLLQEFDAAIDTPLHLLISAYLYGDVVPERKKVSSIRTHMPAI